MRILDTVSIRREGTLYVARCERTGISTQGRSMAEALANLREALALLEDRRGGDA